MSKFGLMDSIRQEVQDTGSIEIGQDTGSIEIGQENQIPNTTGEQIENFPEKTEASEEYSFENLEKPEENISENLEEPEENSSDTIKEQIENFNETLQKAANGLLGSTEEENSSVEESPSVEESTGAEESSRAEESSGAKSSTEEETEPYTEIGPWEKITNTVGVSTLWIAGGILLLVLILLGVWIFVHARRKKKMIQPTQRPQYQEPQQQEPQYQGQQHQRPQYQEQVPQNPQESSASIGKLHHVGRRRNQQDSFGVMPAAGGLFAVVADGMGGLSEGDKISQQIVMLMLQDASGFGSGPKDRVLFELVSHANQEINRMLGVSDQYVSGSTVVAAFVENGCFHWVSVGDSRIYLYRNQRLVQLNREHTYEAELLIQAVNGEIPFEDVHTHPKRGGLTSFIGMGELRYIDGSSRGIRIQKGDRLLLMTDGVFNTLSEEEMCGIVQSAGCAENVAAAMQERILAYGRDKQDNFTAVILDL